VDSPRKPWWQQATALVSLSAGGAITGFAFAPGTADQVASPASIPVTLTALDHATRPAAPDDSAVRSAIVSVANYYLRMAQSKAPAEMEALIWQRDSTDGADHGESCAAFASMTLALAAQMVGRQSWVTGGSTYPWPLQDWADVRVDPNPASPGITSILQDAQAHQRWHPLGDGYQPLPGDWVLFNGHVEVVTKYSAGVLSTVGGDSLPNFSVNAHEYPGPLAAQGVAGFVSNGNLPSAASSAASGSTAAGSTTSTPAGSSSPAPAGAATGSPTAARSSTGSPATQQADEQPAGALAAVPGTVAVAGDTSAAVQADGATIPGVPQAAPAAAGHRHAARPAAPHQVASPQAGPATRQAAGQNATSRDAAPDVAIPGMPSAVSAGAAGVVPSATYTRPQPASSSASASSSSSSSGPAAAVAPTSSAEPGTAAERAFINQVAPGAIAAQRTYGVPASVTIAQAIDESAWGQSTLTTQDHNLFGIKGTGPAGSASFPTQEFQNGQWVTISAQFRTYQDVAQSIEDHGKLLASSGYYTAAMAERQAPDRFAQALTGVYATNPDYGNNLVGLMQRYNLYRFDTATRSTAATTAPRPATPSRLAAPATRVSPSAVPPVATATAPALPTPHATPSPAGTPHATPRPPATTHAAAPPLTPPHVTTRPAATPSTSTTPLAAPRAATTPAATASGPPVLSPHAVANAPAAHGGGAQARASAVSPAPNGGQARPATAPASRPTARATTPPSRTVPHPFATPQPTGPSTGPSTGETPPDQAAIPGIASGSGVTSAHTSAELRSSGGTARPRSSSDTEVVAELAAVFRPAKPAGKAAPSTAPVSRSRSGSSETSSAKRAQPGRPPVQKKSAKRKATAAKARKPAPRYQPQMPAPVKNAFLATARRPLARAELMYRDVAGTCGISWKLLAACDWMQCEAHPRYSPVQGEKLGAANADGTVYRTKSEALSQCARDLVALADTVYGIDLTVPVELSVLELGRVFAAFRWGGLLRLHNTSAMEFPYSVQGLTEQHTGMRWPRIAEPNVPDKPGARFRRPFGAVPVVLSLDYPATV